MPDVNPRLLAYARRMRRAPTRGEGRVWSWLRHRRFGGYKFRRQVPIGGYIVDFFCQELMLAIEIDGSQHQTAWMNEYDGRRLRSLRGHGVEVVRITNFLLVRDARLAAECIQAAIDRRAANCAPRSRSGYER